MAARYIYGDQHLDAHGFARAATCGAVFWSKRCIYFGVYRLPAF
jgi:uncharacterized membrane protein YjgN (DUF898 family)